MANQNRKSYAPNWQKAIVNVKSTVREVLKCINESGALMACILDEDKKFLGIMTDSDVRRLLLNDYSIDREIYNHFNQDPIIGNIDSSEEELMSICNEYSVRELPLIDQFGQLKDIFILNRRHVIELSPNDQTKPDTETTKIQSICPMFLFAGGKGLRLRSVISDRPKPLAMVGDKPILQTIIERAKHCGFRDFYISVNYLAEQIEEHLKQGHYSDLNFNIVKEDMPLGTAGSISLIQKELTTPVLVSNADLLTTLPYHKVLYQHLKQKADITCVVRPHEIVVPFGVVNLDRGLINSISEKPRFTYFVNAGIYVISPEVIKEMSYGAKLDMPDLINRVLSTGGTVQPFLAHEYWQDIGQPSDFQKANEDFNTHFGAH